MTQIVTLSPYEFFRTYKAYGGNVWYYRLIRAFVYKDVIYLRENAIFLFPDSKEKLIAHEQGHLDGKTHTWFGIMAWHGLFRM